MPGISWDLTTGLGGAPSNLAGGTALSGTTAANGSWVDADLAEGQVFGELNCGAVTGAPTSFTVTGKLQEADDSSGTNSQDIAVQTTQVLSASSTRAMIRGQRTKRWIRVVATPAFVAGTSPTIPVQSSVLFQLRRANALQT